MKKIYYPHFGQIWKNPDLAKWEKAVALLVTLGHTICCLPIQFDVETEMYRVTPFCFIFRFWHLRLLHLTLDNIYLLYQFPIVLASSMSGAEMLKFYVHLYVRLVSCLAAMVIAINPGGSVAVLNTLYSTRKVWKDRFGPWGSDFVGPKVARFTKCVQVFAIVIAAQGMFPMATHLRDRHSVQYWGFQVFSRRMYDSPPGIILAALSELNLGGMAIYCSGYCVVLTVSFCVTLSYWTETIRTKIGQMRERNEKCSLETPRIQYRCILVFLRILNEYISRYMLPLCTGGGFWNMAIMLCIIIKYHDRVHMTIVFNLIMKVYALSLVANFCFGSCSQCLVTSVELKRIFFIDQSNKVYTRRMVRSLKTFQVKVGAWNTMKRSTLLAILDELVQQVIDMLLILP